jgi:AcrR family transcriptional regulator
MNALKNEELAKDKILQVAAELFAQSGLDGVSTRDIARVADLNVSLISYYFGGKEGLYRAIIQNFAHQAQSRVDALLAEFEPEFLTAQSFREALRRLVLGILELKTGSPAVAAILQREIVAQLPYAREIYETVFIHVGEKLVGFIKKAQTKKIVRADIHPYVFFMLLVESINGYSFAMKADTQFCEKCISLVDDKEQFIDQVIKIFSQGIEI